MKSKKRIIIAFAVMAVLLTGTVLIMSGFNRKIQVGTDRQFFWNSSIVDTQKTTASYELHSPVRQGIVLTADKDWEGSFMDSFCVVDGTDKYMMYYMTYDTKSDVKVCLAESSDGIYWQKPELNLTEFNGSKANNIVFDTGIANGFYVFKDSGHNVSENEIFKAAAINEEGVIETYISADGIKWEKGQKAGKIKADDTMTGVGLSSVFWNESEQSYFCYYSEQDNNGKNIKVITSKNFSKWSKAKKVTYQKGAEHYDMQTANIAPYYRGENMIVGLPLRVTAVDETVINANFKNRADGTDIKALTDTVFMYSADGRSFDLAQDAWLAPGPENDTNWVFGDSFVAGGMLQTSSIHSDKGQDDEISLYVAENMLAGTGTNLARYTMRIDGFASYSAPYNTKKLVTRPIVFDGSRMTLNFSTSTDGYVYVRILDKNGKPFEDIEYTKEDGTVYTVPQYTSYKMIGDRVDREVAFNGDISALAGKPVVLEFWLSDADICSFKFDNEEYTVDGQWLPQEIDVREHKEFVYSDEPEKVDIGTDRQLFWDNYIVDTAKTDAVVVSHSPERKEEIFKTDLPWEGDNCDFYVIMEDEDESGQKYHRMYYLGWDMSDHTDIKVCYAYSYDGSNWIKPNLGLHSFTDKETGTVYTDTNIVLYTEEDIFDNFFVMKDTRPGVPDSQRYKAICQGSYDQMGYPSYGLWAWVSPDGFHWTKTHRVLPQNDSWFGSFDSVNSLLWDENSQKFFTFFRVRENQTYKGTEFIDFRKIYGATGEEYKPFDTETVFEVNFGEDQPLFEMYTNNVEKYYRAPQLFIGFPTRFSRNTEWIKNYEYLTDPVTRLEKYNGGQITRTLSMTDTMFMVSRDGYTWNRQNEAYITPGPEYQANWIYGNCYPAYGIIETAGDTPGEDPQMSTYLFEGKFYTDPSVVYRYALRLDGFKSYKGDHKTQKVITKPLTFEGSEMLVNFKTSAAGSLEINILDENGNAVEGYSSGEIKGNDTDRKVVFEKDLAQLNGTNAVIEFVLKDAEIYSFKFE